MIPCHRVIGSDGDLVGYAGKRVELKQRLLAVEGVNARPAGDHDFKVHREAMYTLMNGEVEYCLPTCGSLAERPLSELTLFGTRERAEAAGFGALLELPARSASAPRLALADLSVVSRRARPGVSIGEGTTANDRGDDR